MLKRVVVSFAEVTDRWNDKELLEAVKAAILHITVPVKPLNVALLVDLGRPCTARLHPGIGPGRVPRRVSLSLGGSQFRLSLPLAPIADATLDRSRDTVAACLTTTVKQQQFTEADLVTDNKPQPEPSMVACPSCRVCQPQDEFETSELTGKRVCPSCGYEGTFNQAAWDALFGPVTNNQGRGWGAEAQKMVQAAPPATKPTKKLTEYIEDLAHRSRDLRDGARDRMDGSRFQGRVEACDEILRMLRALDL